jgi:glycosyltransferase involved in cell wall biosynthesis
MIRLLSIQPVAERGGSDQALLRMVRSLPSSEFDCHVVVPAEPPLRPELEAAGATVHVVPMHRISTSHRARDWIAYVVAWPVTVARLTRLVRRCRADVVHTNSLHSLYGWAAAALARRPHVWHAREIVVQSSAALRLERRLARHFATRVIAASHAIADQLDSDNVTVVHDGVDAETFSPDRAGAFRNRVGIADDVALVGWVGRIDTWKGLDVLLDAWSEVARGLAGTELVIAGLPVAGKEDYAHAIAARADDVPGVHWLGARDDAAELIADLDVLVVASTEPEPYGLTLVEALASGTPVVATDSGGPREIVASAPPGAGRLVRPGDAPALAQAIVATVSAHPTSTARRRTRTAQRPATAEDVAPVLRAVVARTAR